MSPGNCGVFQFLKEVIFEGFWYFSAHENGAILGVSVCGLVHITLWVGGLSLTARWIIWYR
jgi:hypothetical protein